MNAFVLTAETVFFIYLSFIAGAMMFRLFSFSFESRLKQTLYAVLTGYGIWGLIGLLLGLAGVFERAWLWFFVLVFVLWGRKIIGVHVGHAIRIFSVSGSTHIAIKLYNLFRYNTFLKIIIFVWLLLHFTFTFVPITGNDALRYHLKIIQGIMASGKIGFVADTGSIYSAIPFFAEIFYAVPPELFGNTQAPFIFQLLQYSALLIFLGLFYECIKTRVSHSFLYPVLFVAVLSLFDFTREVLHGGYIDVFVYLFGIASTLLIIECIDTKCFSNNTNKAGLHLRSSASVYVSRGLTEPDGASQSDSPAGEYACRAKHMPSVEFRNAHLYLSAFLLGIALSMKYTALFFVPINGLFLVVLYWKSSAAVRIFFRAGIFFALIGFAVSGYWYIKNAILFGNPFYPMFSLVETKSDIGMFIMERSLINFFVFPFAFFGNISETDSSSKLLILVYLIAIYLFLLFFIVARVKLSFLEIALLLFIHLYGTMMFFMSHQIRFLLPAIIILPLLLILFAEIFFTFIKEKTSQHFYHSFVHFVWWLSCIVAFLLFFANIHYFYVKFLYKTGFYTTEQYIEEIGGQ